MLELAIVVGGSVIALAVLLIVARWTWLLCVAVVRLFVPARSHHQPGRINLTVVDREAGRGGAWSAPLADGLDWRVAFSYQDGDGRRSAREVVVRAIVGDASGRPDSVEGYCLMRRAPRTFLLKRMDNLVDLTTGEAIDRPAAWLAHALEEGALPGARR